MNLSIFLIGMGITGIWWYGAVWAYWRKRRWVMWGLFLAGLFAIPFTIVSADGNLPELLLAIAGVSRALVAALLVGGFRAAQPTHASRPVQWTP